MCVGDSMKKFIGNKTFYKSALAVIIPVLFQQLLTNMVTFVDNFMVGQLGSDAIGGVYIANEFFFIITTAVFGLGGGAAIYLSQFRGAKKEYGISQTFNWLIKRIIVIMTVVAVAVYFSKDFLIGLYTSDADTIASAKAYIDIIVLSYIPTAIVIAFSISLRTLNHAKWTLLVAVVSLISNIVLNAIFIYGMFGAPAMGVAGAALSTVISRVIQVIIYIIIARRLEVSLKFRNWFKAKPSPTLKSDIMKKSYPIVATEMLWAMSLVVANIIFASRGNDVLTALSIRVSICMFGYIAFSAINAAVSIIIGNSLGKNDMEEAKTHFWWLGGLCFVMATAVAGILILITPFIVPLFNASDEVLKLSYEMIVVTGIMFPFFAIISFCVFVLRTGGMTKTVAIFDSLWNWTIYVPIAFIVITFTDLSPITAFIVIWSTDILKSIVALVMTIRFKWLNNLVEKH